MELKIAHGNQRVVKMAERLKDVLNQIEAPDDQSLASARWAFASALMQNLAVKERHLYTKLEQDSRPEVAAYFALSKADLLSRFEAYTEHMATWSTSSALGQWSIYRVKAIHVIDIFVERLQTEQSLLAYAKRHNIDISTPSSATTNWTRKAFEVKDQVETR